MKIIGFNLGHDSSVCFIEDGIVRYAIEEEKISRIKQAFGLPINALNRLLHEYKLVKEDIDIIAITDETSETLGKNEIKYRFTKSSFFKKAEYLSRVAAYYFLNKRNISAQENKAVILKFFKKLGFKKASVEYFNHHLGHAASAYYTSPISCDLVVTCDGHGGYDSLNYYVPGDAGLKLIRSNNYKASVGLFYSMITKLLGFRPTRHEGKITGLAALGKKTELVEKFGMLFTYTSDKYLERFPFENVAEYWRQYGLKDKLSWVQSVNLKTSSDPISSDYAARAYILLKKLEELSKGFSNADVAFACQAVTEKVLLNDLDIVMKSFFTNKENVSLCLAGGVFSNVRCNQKILEHPNVKNVFIQPAMGDAGLALGNAILADITYRSRDFSNRNYQFKNSYYGPDYTKEIEPFIKSLDSNSNVIVKKMDSPVAEVASLIFKNQIVGFWHGRMEWGPRALGSRSIILNTFDKTVNDTLNERLDRTDFMPFAPSVLDHISQKYFPAYNHEVPAADYMTITYDTDKKYHQLLQAVVHTDGTARPQVVRKNANEYYYLILEEFYKLSGCGAVINTSFNAHEEPIVNSPEVAFGALINKRIDCLVLENYLLTLKGKAY